MRQAAVTHLGYTEPEAVSAAQAVLQGAKWQAAPIVEI